jgi:hypothetical protein
MESPTASPAHGRDPSLVQAAEDLTERSKATLPAAMNAHSATSAAPAANPEVFVAPQNPLATLEHLPEELVAQITEYLPTVPLDQFSRTNKRHKRIADARLYSEIEWASEEKRRTVVNNPELAKNVKTIEVLFAWAESTDNDNYNDHFIMALTHAVNLQELSVFELGSYNTGCRSKHLQKIWSAMQGGIGSEYHGQVINTFANLSTLKISLFNQSLGDLEVIFRLPALTHLELSSVYQAIPIRNWSIPESSSNITTLDIRECRIDSEALAQLISYIKALRTLHYAHDPLYHFADIESKAKPRFSWSMICDALQLHQNSLIELDLAGASKESDDATFLGESRPGTLGSLRNLHKLRSLDVELHALINLAFDNDALTDSLPSNLESLKISLDGCWVDTTYCAAAIESLKDVFIRGSDRRFTIRILPGAPYAQLRLSGALKTLVYAGIKVEIVHDAFDRKISIDTLRGMETDGYEDYADLEAYDSNFMDGEEDSDEDYDYYGGYEWDLRGDYEEQYLRDLAASGDHD